MSDLFKDMGLYFNTTDELEKLPEYIGKAKTQNERVLQILKEVNTHITPFECLAYYELKYPIVPITSIRRALTTLVEQGLAEKVDVKKQGIFGRKNMQWRLKK